MSVDEIPVDPINPVAGFVESADVPVGFLSINNELASRQVSTNMLAVFNVARWWYVHGRSTSDPVFRWAIEWTRYLATDDSSLVQRYDAFLDRHV